jgi:hypothetical protein
MVKKKLLLIALTAFCLFSSGCLQETQETDEKLDALIGAPALEELSQETAVDLCVNACLEAKAQGRNLSPGPCLLDPIDEIPAWVCDVAHSPRTEADDQRENQCDAWHDKSASHFVEVDPECEFIKAA